MKRKRLFEGRWAALFSAACGLVAITCSVSAADDAKPPVNEEAAAYAFGILFAKDAEGEFQAAGLKMPIVARAVEDVALDQRREMGRISTLRTLLQLKSIFEDETYTPPIANDTEDPNPAKLKTKRDRQSYAAGIFVTKQMAGFTKQRKYNIDRCYAGFLDTLNKKEMQYDSKTLASAYGALFDSFREADKKEDEERGKKALADGQKFLAANAKRAGIKTLPNGLQYKVVKEGSGESPAPSGVVQVHYRIKYLNGKEFDSSYGGGPAEVHLDRVLPGWSEALQRMKRGGKWIVFLPPGLAYGEKGSGGDRGFGVNIPPHSTVISELELVEIIQ
jgi:FKBP-type peptidyl-prolyl cis-trans isomerase